MDSIRSYIVYDEELNTRTGEIDVYARLRLISKMTVDSAIYDEHVKKIVAEKLESNIIDAIRAAYEAEWTCHDTGAKSVNLRRLHFQCSKCEATLILCDDSLEPTLTHIGTGTMPAFCPHCGAKVVR